MPLQFTTAQLKFAAKATGAPQGNCLSRQLNFLHPSSLSVLVLMWVTPQGTVYISGGGGSAERMPLVPLHDPGNGIAVVMHCFEIHGAHLLPENVDFCANLKSTYGKYTYSDVMNTTFALVPAGRSPASFRLGEVSGATAVSAVETVG